MSNTKRDLKSLDLTQNEIWFMEALIEEYYAEPGFSDVDLKDIAKILKWPFNPTKGVLGSLVKKGILYTEDCGTGYDLIYLCQEYWDLHPTWYTEK